MISLVMASRNTVLVFLIEWALKKNFPDMFQITSTGNIGEVEQMEYDVILVDIYLDGAIELINRKETLPLIALVRNRGTQIDYCLTSRVEFCTRPFQPEVLEEQICSVVLKHQRQCVFNLLSDKIAGME